VLHVGPPKTRAGRRTVGLPRFVVDALAGLLVVPGAPEDYVFAGPHGGALRGSLYRSRFWRPAVQVVGLDGLRIHDLRNTAVALWIAAGANPKEVAARAGHASVSFTLDRYGHLYPEADLSLRERLDAIFAANHRGTRDRLRPHCGPAAVRRRVTPLPCCMRHAGLRVVLVGVTGLEPVTLSL
jgi:integrase